MGYSVLTQAELDLVDLNNVKIYGKKIDCVPRPNNENTLFILQGDQFTEYTLEGIRTYLENNHNDWN